MSSSLALMLGNRNANMCVDLYDGNFDLKGSKAGTSLREIKYCLEFTLNQWQAEKRRNIAAIMPDARAHETTCVAKAGQTNRQVSMLSAELHITGPKLEAFFFRRHLDRQLVLLQALQVAIQPLTTAHCLLTGCFENSIASKIAGPSDQNIWLLSRQSFARKGCEVAAVGVVVVLGGVVRLNGLSPSGRRTIMTLELEAFFG